MLPPGMAPAGAGHGVPPGADSFVRRTGKGVVLALHAVLRALKLYPIENAAVQKALAELAAVADVLVARDHELTIRLNGEVLFVNDTRLRLELDSYAAFGHVVGLWRAFGIGRLTVLPGAGAREWLALLTLLQRAGASEPAARFADLVERLGLAGVRAFELGAAADEAEEEDEQEAKAASKRLYAQSVAVAKEVLQSARMGRPPSLRRLKRAVQGLVDQILGDETPLLGLTTLRDYDEYTFTHSVNVAIFAVAIGKRLGLTKLQLYDLGLGAVLHDIGKTRLPLDVINKSGGLTPEEWHLITTHPWQGVLALFTLPGTQELPLRAMRVAYEHHLKKDGSGYPRAVRPRSQGLFSRIVAVADGFDAATSRRSYQATPWDPADVLREMRDNPTRGHDPVIVKALINTLGIYPVGTLVILDSFELAIVHAAPSGPETLSRPTVRVISDALGNVMYPGHLLDLGARDASGEYVRTIINTADPARYGIRISDFFI